MIKLWNAPRTREWFTGPDRDDYIELDGRWRVMRPNSPSRSG